VIYNLRACNEAKSGRKAFCHMNRLIVALPRCVGSERQRQSGATGERLKEASGINVSLTVLGQVIMALVDAQHGRRRHVPYRNSRLTFLLQVWSVHCVVIQTLWSVAGRHARFHSLSVRDVNRMF